MRRCRIPFRFPVREASSGVWSPAWGLEIMAGGDSFDLTGLGRAAARPDVHDLLTFLTGDFRPVIRVSRIRQIFVLFELFANRPDQVVRSKAAALLGKSV